MRSLIRSRLLLSGGRRVRGEENWDARWRCGSLTKETEIAGVDDRFCVGFAREIIEGGETTTDVCNAEDAAMDGVEDFCLCVDLM